MSASAVRMTTPRPSWATEWRGHDRGDVNRWSWRPRWPHRQPGATGRHHGGAAAVRRSGAGSQWEPVEPAPQARDAEVRTARSRSTGRSAGPRPPVHERAIVVAALAHRNTSATSSARTHQRGPKPRSPPSSTASRSRAAPDQPTFRVLLPRRAAQLTSPKKGSVCAAEFTRSSQGDRRVYHATSEGLSDHFRRIRS
jgi:hypothetical protein